MKQREKYSRAIIERVMSEGRKDVKKKVWKERARKSR